MSGRRRLKELAVAVTMGAVAAVLLSASSTALAQDAFYVDPINGSATGDGSQAHPWKTLEGVIQHGRIQTRQYADSPVNTTFEVVNPNGPVGPGDTLWLMSGYHGDIFINKAYNEDMITIAAAPDQTPTASRVRLRSAANWTIKGLSISGSFAPVYKKHTLVRVESHSHTGPSHHITIEDNDIFSVPDASVWSGEDWVHASSIGIGSGGDHVRIINNRVRNVRFGITAGGAYSHVAHNVIDGFSADGMRGLGDFGVFEYNVIKNSVPDLVDDPNHDDGFQSWSRGPSGVGTGVVKGIVLRGNLFINDTNPDDDLTNSMQGIGAFDGMFEDWLIENNVIITDHLHGISLYGARNCTIINNTVLDPYAGGSGPAWILIHAHKNGTTGTGNVIRNNMAASFKGAPGTTLDHNLDLSGLTLTNLFVDPTFDANGFDLHLVSGSQAVDAGSATSAPTVDRDGVRRPQATAVDIGAYEWQSP